MKEKIDELIKYAVKIKNHNYASDTFRKNFGNKIIILAIKHKRELIKKNPDYLAMYDEEIDFLIEMLSPVFIDCFVEVNHE